MYFKDEHEDVGVASNATNGLVKSLPCTHSNHFFGCLSFFASWGWRPVIFQLSGFYFKLDIAFACTLHPAPKVS